MTEKILKQIKETKEEVKVNKNKEWGETIDGIIKALGKMEETDKKEFNYFDPYLNESISFFEKFVSEYTSDEVMEIKDLELLEKIEKIKISYLKIGFFISKIFLPSLFTEKEMEDFQSFMKKLHQFRDEIYETISFCNEQSPNSETNKLFKRIDDNNTLYLIEEIKRKFLLLGFLVGTPFLKKSIIFK